MSSSLQDKEQQPRGSWGSQSLESMTSINSILSEEGSLTSNGSFESSDRPQEVRRPPQSLSTLLESVHPPSNTPDSMLSCESPSVMRLSRADSEPEEVSLSSSNGAKFKMGSKFKQSIQQIEELKRKGKRELKGFSDKMFQKDISKNDLARVDHDNNHDNSTFSQSPNCSAKDLTNPLTVMSVLPFVPDERVSNEVILFWSLCSFPRIFVLSPSSFPIIRIALI